MHMEKQFKYILFQMSFHYRLLQATEYGFLCGTVDLYCFIYFIHNNVYILIPKSSFTPPSHFSLW